MEEPYRSEPPGKLNGLGLRERRYYRTADVCQVLGISPDVLRWRFMTGKYGEVTQDGFGRIYTLQDIERLLLETARIGRRTRRP